MNITLRSLLLAALLFPGAVSAATATNSAWSVRVWQSDDGLPNNIVTGLAQTQDGYLWVANPTRLARFDGVQFEEFPTGLLTGGFNQRITTLASGRDGSLWVATDRGVVAGLKAGAMRVFTNNLPYLFVESLVEDGTGSLWIKNRGGDNICRIVDGKVSQVPLAGSYRSVAVDGRGRLWFVRNGEVGCFRNDRFETLVQLGKPASARLTGAKTGGVWICLGSTLFKYDGESPAVSCGEFPVQSASTEPLAMLEDRSGTVWIGTSDSGLFRYCNGSFETIPVSHRQIFSLLEDREGNVWAGTGGGGLERVQPKVVELEGQDSSLPFQAVQSVCQDAGGNVWAVTQNGLLICRTNGVWQTISTSTNWPGGRASCVTADRSGAVWIGTRGQRLCCWRNGVFTSFRAADGFTAKNIHALVAATNGDLWVAGIGQGGLQHLHDGHWETLPLPPGPLVVHGLTEDAAGNLWFGTSKGLLMRARDSIVTDETPRTTGMPLSIRTVETTTDGMVWIGYAGGGLGWFGKDGRFTRITSAQGLFDDHISQIIADDQGWLWLGGDHGIFKIRRAELDGVAAKRLDHVISVHYGPGEGLPGLQANFGESPGVLHDRDGRLWMPMRTALAVINPASLREDPEPPPVLLTQVIIDDQITARYGGVVPLGKMPDTRTPLRLPPDHRHLEFIYTALSFDAPENLRFQYQLQGFDNDWVNAGTERRASYSRLAAGKYQFRVRACNSNGNWSDATAGLAFVVAPFFWQTWWFWLVALLAFTSAVVAIVRFVSHRQLLQKVQALERQAALDRERTRIARDIHDDIGNLLTKTTLLSGLMQRDRDEPEKTAGHAREIASTVEQVTNSLDEIVWAVNPHNDTLPQLVDYIGQFAMDFLNTAGIRCRVDLPDHPPRRPVSSELRHGLFLAVKEALNNAVRHAGAHEVSLGIAATDTSLSVTIRDTGQGFALGENGFSGNGLGNMRARMTEIGGEFHVQTAPGNGTQISLVVPWPRQNGRSGTTS